MRQSLTQSDTQTPSKTMTVRAIHYRTLNEPVKTKSGVSLPGWQDRIERGASATTAFSATIQEVASIRAVDMSIYYRHPTLYPYNVLPWLERRNEGTYWWRAAAHVVWDAVPPLQLRTTANNGFLAKVHDALTDVEGFTVMAELRKTVSGLRRPLSAIRDLLKKRRRYLRELKKALARNRKLPERQSREAFQRAVSGTWLEAQFGLLPLIGTIEDGCKAVRRLDKMPAYKPVSYIAETKTRSFADYSQSNSLSYDVYFRLKRDVEQSTRVYGAVRLKENNSFQNAAGFTWQSMVLAGHEVIPYSWLVDYIIPIGGALKAALARRTEISWSAMTTRDRIVKHYYTTGFAPDVDTGYQWMRTTVRMHGDLVLVSKRIDRRVWSPVVTLPHVKVRDDLGAILNTIAAIFTRGRAR